MHVLGIRLWRVIGGDFARNDVKVPAVQVQFKCVPLVAANDYIKIMLIMQIASP